MRRRHFINTSVLSGLGLAIGACKREDRVDIENELRGIFSLDDHRGEPFREFSHWMAAAYTVNTHFQTGEKISTKESFTETMIGIMRE